MIYASERMMKALIDNKQREIARDVERARQGEVAFFEELKDHWQMLKARASKPSFSKPGRLVKD